MIWSSSYKGQGQSQSDLGDVVHGVLFKSEENSSINKKVILDYS